MATFILIHGAWHGGWCWDRLIPLLKTQGHRVLAPDLPGVEWEGWIQSICDLVCQQDEKVVLVGHSRGGIVISQIAEYCADHIQKLIYLTAFLIPNGETILGIIHRYSHLFRHSLDLVFSPDHRTSTVTEEAVRQIFYNTTSETWIQQALMKVGPEPMESYKIPLTLTEEQFGRIPRAYIECLQDRAIPIDLQRIMLSILPCQTVVTIDTDHSPFYSVPELLTRHLIELA